MEAQLPHHDKDFANEDVGSNFVSNTRNITQKQ